MDPTTSRADQARCRILTVADYLGEGLHLPEYQRPYKWSPRHVDDLLGDVQRFAPGGTGDGGEARPARYRLGTAVLHHNAERHTRDIVDGQQRTVTLVLILLALGYVDATIDTLARGLWFPSQESRASVQENLRHLQGWVLRQPGDGAWRQGFARTLLDDCEMVVVTLDEVAEAFQFFDSQNSRGRALRPHDLLKAHHLRTPAPPGGWGRVVARWEAWSDDRLARFIGDYLFRIDRWSRGLPAEDFTSAHLDTFKGLDSDDLNYPCHQGLKRLNTAHPADTMPPLPAPAEGGFPFALDQPVIAGHRFFAMIEHYADLAGFDRGNAREPYCFTDLEQVPAAAGDILALVNTNPERDARGDHHVRTAFDALLLLYLDRFGTDARSGRLAAAADLIFAWAYTFRLAQGSLGLVHLEKHIHRRSASGAREVGNPFARLRAARRPADFLSLAWEPPAYVPKRVEQRPAIAARLRALGHAVPVPEATP